MQALLELYWPVIVIALLVGIVAGHFVFRPKQNVRLSDSDTPRRPHMDAILQDGQSREGKGVVDASAAGLTDEYGQFMQAEIREHLPGATGEPDDLTRLKGVGPKLAGMLNQIGLVRFEQIAELNSAQIASIDQRLGSFKGRLARDKVVDQAAYLARGDTDGYEARFGKL